jgi:hypothetical protein
MAATPRKFVVAKASTYDAFLDGSSFVPLRVGRRGLRPGCRFMAATPRKFVVAKASTCDAFLDGSSLFLLREDTTV